MQKGEGWGEKFSPEFRNGDWDFAIFSPKGERLVKKDLNDCRACHQPFAETQHLFLWSIWSINPERSVARRRPWQACGCRRAAERATVNLTAFQ